MVGLVLGALVLAETDDGLDDVPIMCCVGATVGAIDGLVAVVDELVGAYDSRLSGELGPVDGAVVMLVGTFVEGLAVVVGTVELVGTDDDEDGDGDGDGLAVVGRPLAPEEGVGLAVLSVTFIGDLVGVIVPTTLGVGRDAGEGSSVFDTEDVGAVVGTLVELLVLEVVGAFDAELDGLLLETPIVAVGELVGTPPPCLESVGLWLVTTGAVDGRELTVVLVLGAKDVVGILLGIVEPVLGVFVVGLVVLLLGGHNPAWVQTPVQ